MNSVSQWSRSDLDKERILGYTITIHKDQEVGAQSNRDSSYLHNQWRLYIYYLYEATQ